MDHGVIDLERFIERLPLGIIVVSADLRVEMRNDLSFNLLDIGVENLLNTDFLGMLKEYPALKDIVLQVHSGKSQQQHLVLPMGDKVLSCSVLSAGDMPAGGLIILLEDATNVKKIEQIKREFISTLLHRIRSPLATMKTSLSMLKYGMVHPETSKTLDMHEIFTMCYDEVNRLSALISDMRDLFLIETKLVDKDLEIEVFPVYAAIASAIGDLKKTFSPEIVQKRIISEENIELLVNADFVKTKKIFFVLLKNALQYSAADSPVEVSCSALDDSINIIIKDHGIGISDSMADQIFGKFFREDNFTTRNSAGNGLGLFIAKSYIELMNGAIFFESKHGEGTSFHITLPLHGRK